VTDFYLYFRGAPYLIVEFVGLPGAGKSTLRAAVLDELARRDIPHVMRDYQVPPLRMSLAIGKQMLVEPRFTVLSIAAILRAQVPLPRPALQLIISWLNRTSQTRIFRSDQVIGITDGGVFQVLSKLYYFANARRDRTLAGLASRMPLPNLLVVLTVDPLEIRRRVELRGPSYSGGNGSIGRAAFKTPASFDHALRSYTAVLELAVGLQRRSTGFSILELENHSHDDLRSGVQRIMEAIVTHHVARST
jgi:hypothetical protein